MDPVGLHSEVPDILPKLSQLLQIQHQQTQLAGEQQSLKQRQALATFDYNQLLGDDGTFDLNKIPLIRDAAGDQYPEIARHLIDAKSAQVDARGKLLGLQTDTLNTYRSILGGLLQDPDVVEDNAKGRQKVNDAYLQFGETYGPETLPVIEAYAKRLQNVPPGKLKDALVTYQMQAENAGNQLERQRPSYISKGGSLTNVNPYTAGKPQDIDLTLPPGAQAVQAVDQLGNPYITFRDTRGNIVGTAPMGGGPNGPARFGPGERQTYEAQAETNFKNVSANRESASMAPQQLDQIDKALKLSEQVSTGAWAAKRGEIESGLGSLIPGYQGADDASKLQLLDKFAERIATDASKVLGVNATTDAQRESIHKQNANIGYTPKAVQDVLKYAKAQTLAMQAKGDAQETWLKQEGNGITKQHEFETKFRQAYDPRVFQYSVMSPAERADYIKSLSKEDRAEIAKKTRALRELGALPGG